MKVVKFMKWIAYKLFRITIFKRIKTDILESSSQTEIQSVLKKKVSMKKYFEKIKEI